MRVFGITSENKIVFIFEHHNLVSIQQMSNYQVLGIKCTLNGFGDIVKPGKFFVDGLSSPLGISI